MPAIRSSPNRVVDKMPSSATYFALKTADERLNWSPISNVADGTTLTATFGWSPIGGGMHATGLPAGVFAQIVYGGRLIAAGWFDRAGDVPVRMIAAWDGSSWSDLGTGRGNSNGVVSLAVHQDRLIAGGGVGNSDDSPVCAWDGSWAPLGLGASGGNPTKVDAIAVYDNKLIVGGSFAEAGGIPCSNIAMWDGSSWSPLGSGVDGLVYSLVVYNGQLIVGGTFAIAGGYPAAYIASWSE